MYVNICWLFKESIKIFVHRTNIVIDVISDHLSQRKVLDVNFKKRIYCIFDVVGKDFQNVIRFISLKVL